MAHHVLVVDDEKPIVRIIQTNLLTEGYTVSCAHDGIEALEQVQASRPDLILLDVMMPRMDGWGVLRALKAKPETADIPVVMLTALTDVEHMDRGARLGNDCYLTKPFDPSELLAIVGRLLAGIDELGYFGDPPAGD